MLKRTLIILVVLVATLVGSVRPVFAQTSTQQPPCNSPLPCIFVDTSRTVANEDGTQANPYNTTKEGTALLRSFPNGGYLLEKNPNGSILMPDGTRWSIAYVYPVRSGAGGAPLPPGTLYLILIALALVLVFVGWLLKRRSTQLRIR